MWPPGDCRPMGFHGGRCLPPPSALAGGCVPDSWAGPSAQPFLGRAPTCPPNQLVCVTLMVAILFNVRFCLVSPISRHASLPNGLTPLGPLLPASVRLFGLPRVVVGENGCPTKVLTVVLFRIKYTSAIKSCQKMQSRFYFENQHHLSFTYLSIIYIFLS